MNANTREETMRSHARDKRTSGYKLGFDCGRAVRLYRALCGRWMDSVCFSPAAECYCSTCRNAAARKGLTTDLGAIEEG